MTNRYHVGDQPHSIIIRMKRLDREYTLEELKNEYEVTDAPVLKLELQGPLGRYVLEREEREGMMARCCGSGSARGTMIYSSAGRRGGAASCCRGTIGGRSWGRAPSGCSPYEHAGA